MTKIVLTAIAAVLVIGVAAPVLATEHEVRMLNRGEAGMMVFEPAVLDIEPGDTVRFVPTDRGHNAETIRGMLPDGAEPFRGGMGQEFTVTFEQEGVYGYQCLPHYGMGMVGLILVGDDLANLEDAKAVNHRGKADERMRSMFTKIAE